MASETVRIEGLEGVLATLRELPAEVVSKRGGPVRSALRKAALIILDQAKSNVRSIIQTPNLGGDDKSTGLLLLSLQAKRGRLPRGQNGESFVVSIKRGQKYPDWRQDSKRQVTATQVGRLLEYGSERREPQPWLRPAFDAKKYDALRVFEQELPRAIAAIVRRLERKNRNRK